MQTQRIAAVEAGEEVTIFRGTDRAITETIKESCGESNGYWFCVTHDESFPNQLQKDGHIHSGDHKLMWVCFDHGYEKP